jgi:hypothetical protein
LDFRPIACSGHLVVGDGDRAAKIIRGALGIESDDVANYCLPQSSYGPTDRDQRARIIGDRLKAEAQFLA